MHNYKVNEPETLDHYCLPNKLGSLEIIPGLVSQFPSLEMKIRKLTFTLSFACVCPCQSRRVFVRFPWHKIDTGVR